MVRVAVQRDVVIGAQRRIEIARIVHDDDAAFVPDQFQRRIDETESAFGDGRFQRFAFLIVVAEHAPQRRFEAGERVDRFRLSDVAGVDHALDARGIEQLDDAPDVLEIVVGVADDADAHGKKKQKRPQDRFCLFGG